MYVYGESLKSHLIGLVILDEVSLKEDCPEQFHRIPVKELHQSPEFEKFILESLRSLGKEDLCGFEQVGYYEDIIIFLVQSKNMTVSKFYYCSFYSVNFMKLYEIHI